MTETVTPDDIEAATRDLARLAEDNQPGKLRIAVECHTCYDWLMPGMDAYRARTGRRWRWIWWAAFIPIRWRCWRKTGPTW